jgi:murein DD-endopeptidase MepM/ murein hydrolase activator NlpD
MVLARPAGRGFPAAIVALSLTGLLSVRSAMPVPRAPGVAVTARGPGLLADMFAGVSPPRAHGPRLRPLVIRPAPGPVTSAFHDRRRGGAHPGIDIDGETGDPVRAASAGTVLATGPGVHGFSGYGTIVLIAHTTGVTTLYAHLSAVNVAPGRAVESGDLIGSMGCTGLCTGSHLHFEVRFANAPIDPERYLPASP